MTFSRVKDNLGYLIAGLVIFTIAITVYFEFKNSPKVKKSPSGVCHTTNSPYYPQTLTFEAYSALEDCITSGGKVPS